MKALKNYEAKQVCMGTTTNSDCCSPILIILAVVLVLSTGLDSLSAQSGAISSAQLVGGEEAVWFIMPEPASSYYLAAKTIEKNAPWRRVGGEKYGSISTATVIGSALKVFFVDGQYVDYLPDQPEGIPGLKPPEKLWQEGTLALSACPAGDLQDRVFLLVSEPINVRQDIAQATTKPRSLPPQSQPTATSTMPTSTPSTYKSVYHTLQAGSHAYRRSAGKSGNVVRARQLAILQCSEGEWTKLTTLPTHRQKGELLSLPVRAYITASNKAIFVLLWKDNSAALMKLEGGKWQIIEIPKDLQQTIPLTMTIIDNTLVLVAFHREKENVIVTKFSDNKWDKIQFIRRGEKPVHWNKKNLPTVARFGEKLAFAWKNEDDKWLFATSNLEGQIEQAQPLDIFAAERLEKLLETVQNVFLWVVLGIMIILMFWPGQPIRSKPFSLPETMFAAKLPKRTIAACIDMIPFLLPTIILAGQASAKIPTATPITMEEAQRIVATPEFLLAFLGFMTAYPIYCTLMEYRYGATIGKMIMKLRVVGDGGNKASLREIALRNVSKIMELMSLWMIFPILFPILTRYRQRLGDKIAWTAVIDTALSAPPPPPPINQTSGENLQNHPPEQDDDKPLELSIM